MLGLLYFVDETQLHIISKKQNSTTCFQEGWGVLKS